ncbi:hypothetical protein BCR37DRAFT_381520 [Protomyces lactucae-debilis]|uniref:Uncharacterized protein n=1 Tax=Protomyces lactucae-debilis TaxID=2754530 RepID=A0A1Y2F651_PROLT|nr:uncharacterized protein BCR37DRAFT_381520 [Protomyces lactucae-debilis]ORY79378.1 hypothetical protein BCR37DRAFT_381520 [Protomyces lactucae-debilis]
MVMTGLCSAWRLHAHDALCVCVAIYAALSQTSKIVAIRRVSLCSVYSSAMVWRQVNEDIQRRSHAMLRCRL